MVDKNPYTPPALATGPFTGTPTIRYRVFRARSVSFKLLTAESSRDEVRREVQLAIDEEIGAGNVVSIVEHAGAFEAFSVIVWYREGTRQSGVD